MAISNIPELIRANAERYGEKDAIVDGDIRLTFRDLETEMLRVSRALMANGCEPGDRVAIWAPNGAAWITAFLGILASGAAMVPVNTRFRGNEAAFVLRRSKAKALFTVSSFLNADYVEMLRAADPELDVLTVMLDDAANKPRTLAWSTFVQSGDGVEPARAEQRIGEIGPDETAYVLFTSGTTGQPKGALLTHGQNLHYTQLMIDRFKLSSEERLYLVLPLFHMFGLNGGFLMNAAAGATIVLASVFDAKAVMQHIEDERITFLPGPPTIFQDILRSSEREQHDLSSLRKALLSAAGVPPELVDRMLEENLVEMAFSAYGLTEGLVVTCSKPDDDPELIANWSGCALPGVEIKAVGDDGEPVATGEPGEILVRSCMVMKGYLEDPEATARAIDSDGWLHTGDVGVINEDGYLKITDRKKDMFTVGGFNVYPAEVEGILGGHPAIAQVAVVAMPDERMGEAGVAFVILRPDAHAAPDEIIKWSKDNMANYKVPRVVEIVDELPMTASMKVKKHELRDRANAISEARANTMKAGSPS
jgi:acyl-CoA synthetase (AMP-forming)/AMP-acid ligase II